MVKKDFKNSILSIRFSIVNMYMVHNCKSIDSISRRFSQSLLSQPSVILENCIALVVVG